MPFSISSSDISSNNLTAADVCNYATDHYPLFGVPHDAEFNRCMQVINSYKSMPLSDAVDAACTKGCIAKYISQGSSSERRIEYCINNCKLWAGDLENAYKKNPAMFKDLTSEDERNIIDAVKSQIQGNRSYRESYGPFSSDRLSSHPNRVMWIIILVFIVGLIVYVSQRK